MDHSQQVELMRRFIVQEARACESADPEILTVFGRSLVDWFHPRPDRVGGVHVSCMEDGRKVTILVCRPIIEYEPTIMQFWEGEDVSENKAVYFCPNAVLVIRPTEKGDETLIETQKEQVERRSEV